MTTFAGYLKSPEFWFGSVVVAILINVVSHWLISKFPNFLSGVSKKWATRTAKLTAEREMRINKLINNPHEQLFSLNVALHYRGMATIYMVVTAIFLCVAIMGTVVSSMELDLALNLKLTTYPNLKFSRIFILLILAYSFLAIDKVYKSDSLLSEVKEAKNRSTNESR